MTSCWLISHAERDVLDGETLEEGGRVIRER
jgi:hypothetical protein